MSVFGFFWPVFSRIQSECEKIRTRKTLNKDTFHAVFTACILWLRTRRQCLGHCKTYDKLLGIESAQAQNIVKLANDSNILESQCNQGLMKTLFSLFSRQITLMKMWKKKLVVVQCQYDNYYGVPRNFSVPKTR